MLRCWQVLADVFQEEVRCQNRRGWRVHDFLEGAILEQKEPWPAQELVKEIWIGFFLIYQKTAKFWIPLLGPDLDPQMRPRI